MYLILLMMVFALTGVFSLQNDGHQVFRLLGYSWNLPVWAPTAIGVGVVSVLLMLLMSHAGVGLRFRERSLLSENARLRESLAAARGAMGATAPPAQRSVLEGIRGLLPNRAASRDSSPT